MEQKCKMKMQGYSMGVLIKGKRSLIKGEFYYL